MNADELADCDVYEIRPCRRLRWFEAYRLGDSEIRIKSYLYYRSACFGNKRSRNLSFMPFHVPKVVFVVEKPRIHASHDIQLIFQVRRRLYLTTAADCSPHGER